MDKNIPVVILCGGMGTRLAEYTEVRPKPLVEVGGRPILWHIMKHYSHYGFHEFYLALGYKGELIKKYFLDYFNLNGNMTVRLARAKGRKIEGSQDVYELRETGVGYDFMGKNSGLSSENTYFWNDNDEISAT